MIYSVAFSASLYSLFLNFLLLELSAQFNLMLSNFYLSGNWPLFSVLRFTLMTAILFFADSVLTPSAEYLARPSFFIGNLNINNTAHLRWKLKGIEHGACKLQEIKLYIGPLAKLDWLIPLTICFHRRISFAWTKFICDFLNDMYQLTPMQPLQASWNERSCASRLKHLLPFLWLQEICGPVLSRNTYCSRRLHWQR